MLTIVSVFFKPGNICPNKREPKIVPGPWKGQTLTKIHSSKSIFSSSWQFCETNKETVRLFLWGKPFIYLRDIKVKWVLRWGNRKRAEGKLTLASTVNPASVTWEHRAASRILKSHRHTENRSEWCAAGNTGGLLWLIVHAIMFKASINHQAIWGENWRSLQDTRPALSAFIAHCWSVQVNGGTGASLYKYISTYIYVCVSLCFSLESGTVESQCSERGIRDVTAARHTEDL